MVSLLGQWGQDSYLLQLPVGALALQAWFLGCFQGSTLDIDSVGLKFGPSATQFLKVIA